MWLVAVLVLLPWLDRGPHRAPWRRPWTTGLATAVLALAGVLTYKGATAPAPPTAVAADQGRADDVRRLPTLARRGLEVFEEQGCAACHVVRGAGGAGGPDLSRIGGDRDGAWLKAFIVNPGAMGRQSDMPPYDALAPDDLDALVAYLETLR